MTSLKVNGLGYSNYVRGQLSFLWAQILKTRSTSESVNLITASSIKQNEQINPEGKNRLKNSFCSYARPAQPGPNRTRLCGPCIAAIAGD